MLPENENDRIHLFVLLYKQLIFPIYCYSLCAWAPNNWCFQTVVLEETLESPWAARRSNQSILKEISPEYSVEGLMLKLQYFSHQCKEPTHWKRPWSWEKLRAGEGDSRGWDGCMASPIQWTWVWANSRRQWRTGKPGVLQSMGSQRVRTRTHLSDGTITDDGNVKGHSGFSELRHLWAEPGSFKK